MTVNVGRVRTTRGLVCQTVNTGLPELDAKQVKLEASVREAVSQDPGPSGTPAGEHSPPHNDAAIRV